MNIDASDHRPSRIVVAGGTGLIGRHLCQHLLARGDEVLILTRNPAAAPKDLREAGLIPWEPGQLGRWTQDLDGADALIDLAGAPFFTRWKGDYYRREVIGSRARCTRTLLDALRDLRHRPTVFLSGSSVGVYGYQPSDEPVTEATPAGKDFWGEDSLALEQLAGQAGGDGIRVITLRTGVVLARDGGALAGQLPQFTRGFGGVVRPGSQWVPWIHVDDVAGIISTLIDDRQIDGPVNATSPEPVRQRQYAKTLARTVGRPALLPTPGWILRRALGPVATTITHGRRVLPAKALSHGYEFKHPELETALDDLLHQREAPVASARPTP